LSSTASTSDSSTPFSPFRSRSSTNNEMNSGDREFRFMKYSNDWLSAFWKVLSLLNARWMMRSYLQDAAISSIS
jgi:hypothetical protein